MSTIGNVNLLRGYKTLTDMDLCDIDRVVENYDQEALREALDLFFRRADHGSIGEFSLRVGLSRQALTKWRTGKTKRLKREHIHRIKEALHELGRLPQSASTPTPAARKDLIKEQNQAFASLASALESLVVELRSDAAPLRKAHRLRWELDNLRKFLRENFGEEEDDAS